MSTPANAPYKRSQQFYAQRARLCRFVYSHPHPLHCANRAARRAALAKAHRSRKVEDYDLARNLDRMPRMRPAKLHWINEGPRSYKPT